MNEITLRAALAGFCGGLVAIAASHVYLVEINLMLWIVGVALAASFFYLMGRLVQR